MHIGEEKKGRVSVLSVDVHLVCVVGGLAASSCMIMDGFRSGLHAKAHDLHTARRKREKLSGILHPAKSLPSLKCHAAASPIITKIFVFGFLQRFTAIVSRCFFKQRPHFLLVINWR